ncbi:MAG: zinc/iron-chelating domain-containing protein [Desulfobulbus propionicus]|nr:MAG: zinc/iron-chelating domain-containing protein [Desulfobulbus propionicus]
MGEPAFQALKRNEQFQFRCHPDVACFTACCRSLDLALTPYDVLRLKRALNIDSSAFLNNYVIVAWEEGELFPQCFLTMVDDGQASCTFISAAGCRVYEDRPGACRSYPAGRGVSRNPNGIAHEQFVLVQEDHCLGHQQHGLQTVDEFFNDQGLEPYNHFNDAMIELLQHPQVRKGFSLSRVQVDKYLLALYDLDTFRKEIVAGRISLPATLLSSELQAVAGDDEQLLLFGIRWLQQDFFGK